MEPNVIFAIVVAVAVGMIGGAFSVKNTVKAKAVKAMTNMAFETTKAISIVSSLYVDTIVKIEGISRDDAMQRVLQALAAHGIKAQHMQIVEAKNVDQTKSLH